jgi:hypothetical protein
VVVVKAAGDGDSCCIRGTGYNIYGIIFNFTIVASHGVGIPLYFIETLYVSFL